MERCASYRVQGFVRTSEKDGVRIVIHPEARSEYVLSFADKKEQETLSEYKNIAVEARVEVPVRGQIYSIKARLIGVDFVLPSPKQAHFPISLVKEMPCRP